ncbi:hypothetical protein SeLEV6574_g06604 [Synchytrium endobioticum]|nr:hypothetical protein SeLEV6574_g06604 [Synchytrium endobioticum]
MTDVAAAIDPYTDDDPEYRDTPLVSPVPPPNSSTSRTPHQHATDESRGLPSAAGNNPDINSTTSLTSSNARITSSDSIGKRVESSSPSSRPTFRTDQRVPEKQLCDWLVNDKEAPHSKDMPWLKMKVEKAAPVDYGLFSIQELFEKLADLKNQLDALPKHYFTQARTLANPYESIGRAIFVNRSAVKMANVDAVFGFTKELIAPHKPFRFADLCAGPGGFTEYLLWRIHPGLADVRGYGITLKGDVDFAIEKFAPEARAQQRFEAIYGQDGTGDITKPENMRRFAAHIQKSTGDTGVDLVIADGAFSVVGDEIYQEVHSSRLMMCEVVTMFMVLRKGGYFMTKVFDTCTPFMAGLFYLLHQYFGMVTIIKPYTSRPANSERYIICKDLKERRPAVVIQHLLNVNKKFNELSSKQHVTPTSSAEKLSLILYKTMIDHGMELVTQIVDLETIMKDRDFVDFLEGKNTSIAMKQSLALAELLKYASDPSLPAWNQEDVRNRCLQEWDLPLVRVEPSLKTLMSPFEPFSRRSSSNSHHNRTPRYSHHHTPPPPTSSTSSYRPRRKSDAEPSSTPSPPHAPRGTLSHLADVDVNWRERDVIKKTQDRIIRQQQQNGECDDSKENYGEKGGRWRRKAELDKNWRDRSH